jgi:hypothetical protein
LVSFCLFYLHWRYSVSQSCKLCCTALAGAGARVVVEPSRDIESLRGRMAESTRQVEGLFESLLSESFGG